MPTESLPILISCIIVWNLHYFMYLPYNSYILLWVPTLTCGGHNLLEEYIKIKIRLKNTIFIYRCTYYNSMTYLVVKLNPICACLFFFYLIGVYNLQHKLLMFTKKKQYPNKFKTRKDHFL